MSEKFLGEGSPLMLAEVDTMGRRMRMHRLRLNSSRVMRMPALPSSAKRLGAKLRAPS